MAISRRAVLIVSAFPLIAMAVLSGGYLADGALQKGRVSRNVTLAGEAVGGMTRSQVTDRVTELADSFPDTPVSIVSEDLTLDTTAGDLGYSIDVEATVDEAMSIGHLGYSPARALKWPATAFSEHDLPVVLSTDQQQLETTVLALEGDRRTDPINPRIEFDGITPNLIPGIPGRKIDTASITAGLPGSLQSLGKPMEIDAVRETIDPPIADNVMRLVQGHLANTLGESFTLGAGERTVEVTAEQILPLLSVKVRKNQPSVSVDAKAAAEIIAEELPTPSNPTGVTFTIDNGVPKPVAGSDATVCCGKDAGAVFAKAIQNNEHSVELPTVTFSAAEGVRQAAAAGVKEQVSTFTTEHPCCQPRVDNIHRIIDMTRGVYIPPGGSFSVNDFVGERTTEKGFVSAPVIEDGVFTEDVGGGISQFATTLFNAAFFAGLDIPVYKAHSVYISRYPFGREATLAYPSVDLRISNPSPYGVVLWGSYTDTSVTMSLYSTKWATADQTGQTGEQTGEAGLRCGNITTTRTVTLVATGESQQDTFRASYVCVEPEHAD